MKKLFYIFVFLLGNLSLVAQNVEVSASIDTNLILIGEQATIDLKVNYQLDGKTVSVQFPLLKDTINKFVEIVSSSPIDTIFPDQDDLSIVEQSQKVVITSFDSGYYAIPPFQFVIDNDTIETDAILLEVQNVAVDTSQAIFDVKTPLEEPFSIIDWLKENWRWLTGGLVLLILIIGLIVYLVTKKPAPKKEVVKPIIPIHISTLERLEEIKNQKLWQNGHVKSYHSQISEVLRNYIEHRYQVNAMEETTGEIMHGLRLLSIPQELMNKLSQTLTLADLVKFAKETPLANENDMSLVNAFEFVNSTKIVPTQNQENAE